MKVPETVVMKTGLSRANKELMGLFGMFYNH